MQHVEVQRQFDAAPQAVWDRYTDHVSWTDWAGLGRVTLEREGQPAPNGVGCVRVFSTAGFKLCEEVLSFEPPARMTYRVVRGAVHFKNHLGEVLFEPRDGGTLVTWRCQFDSKIPGLGGLFRFAIAGIFRKALEGLARTRF